MILSMLHYSSCHKYVPFEIRKLSEYSIARPIKFFDSANGCYALGNTGNSLPVPEGREDMPNTINFSRLLVLAHPDNTLSGPPLRQLHGES